MVGLPDSAVKESLQRVESALKTNGYHMPRTKLVVNLAPADIRKTGSAFDLAIAIGTLGASEQLNNTEPPEQYVMMGELNLDGTIQPVKGVLPIAITSRREGFKGLIVPLQNAREAAIVNNLKVYGVQHINDVIRFFRDPASLQPVSIDTRDEFYYAQTDFDTDFADVKGQENIKRALEIAAAGGHNAILIGPPGAGKTMLAKRLPTILPPLTLHEALETTRIHSVAGKLPDNSTLISRRPFRSPHHTISDIALVGGGSIPQPGEISLAHNGVLFLDELPEFKRSVLEVMRQPMEERRVTISRAKVVLDFPSSFQLIASMNPCACGFYNHPSRDCTCAPGAVQKYLNKVSGPLLDRIDLQVEVPAVAPQTLAAAPDGEPSAQIAERVVRAQRLAWARQGCSNAQLTGSLVDTHCKLDDAGTRFLQAAAARLGWSARSYHRVLRMARTAADLSDSAAIQVAHLAEAIQYRRVLAAQ